VDSQGYGVKGPGLQKHQCKMASGGKASISHKTNMSSFVEVFGQSIGNVTCLH